MEFEFTEKQLRARDLARTFAREQIRPRLTELETDPRPPTEILRQLGDQKLFAALVPEEQGGAGLDSVGFALILMEIAKVWSPLGKVLLTQPPQRGPALSDQPMQDRPPWAEPEQKVWVAVAALAVGIGQALFEELKSFTAGQTPSGKSLSASQLVQWKLADLATDLEAAELLTFRAAWLIDQHKPFEKEAAMAKQYALNMVLKTSRDAIQIQAGQGLALRNPLLRLIQDAESCQLFNIYDEPLTSIIAKNL